MGRNSWPDTVQRKAGNGQRYFGDSPMQLWRWGQALILGSAFTGLVLAGSSQETPPAAVTQILAMQPMQKGVDFAMPSAAEQVKCTVVGDPNAKPGQNVWVLKDGKGATLRRFVDTNGDKYPDTWGYYKDGMEVYREVDTKFSGKADRYMWLNTAGSKIGISRAANGVIDSWQAISLEELSQEVMKAVATKDWNRYAALLINEEDLRSVGVAAAEGERIKKNLAGANSKFQQVISKLGLNETTKWLHAETGSPSRMLAEATGWKQDVLIYARALVLCDTAGKTEYIQLGDIVRIGETWKLMDAPMTLESANTGGLMAGPGNTETPVVEDGPLQKVLKELADLDGKAPQEQTSGPSPNMVAYHSKRAEVINRIIAVCPEKDRENWYKQIIDSLSATVSASSAKDTAMLKAFRNYVDQLVKQAPGSEVAGYGLYRVLTIENSKELQDVKDGATHLKVQGAFADRLVNFVNSYPAASDTPDALYRLGEIYEQLTKEADARKWYETLATRHKDTKQAAKAQGAVRRLSSIGQTWDIGVNAVSLDQNQFNAQILRGRTVVVYYWHTWSTESAADFKNMKQVLAPYQSKGVVLVAVNIDDKVADAQAFLQKNVQSLPPAFHLHSAGGYESPAVMHYGLNVFPAMFLQDSQGKITSRTLDVATLDEELKKIVK